MTPLKDKAFWMSLRQALLMAVDAIERRPDVMHKPRTAQLRRLRKDLKSKSDT